MRVVDLPNCGYLEDYSIAVGQTQLLVSLTPKGYIDVCSLIKRAFPQAKCVMREDKTPWFGGQIIAISGSSPNHSELKQYLCLLKDHLTIDTSLDEYHALGLYSTPMEKDWGTDWQYTWIGKLVNKAKYSKDENVAGQIADHFANFIEAHPCYRRAKFIVSVPRAGKSDTLDLSCLMVKRIAGKLHKTMIMARKVRATKPQKDLWESDDIRVYRRNIKGSMRVDKSMSGYAVILVDDTSRSCATLEELGRACRTAGAIEVLGLTAARDAKFTQGIDLSEGPWHEQ